MAEDGEISPGKVKPSKVMRVIKDAAKSHNFEHCPGPIIEQTDEGEAATCMSFSIEDY